MSDSNAKSKACGVNGSPTVKRRECQNSTKDKHLTKKNEKIEEHGIKQLKKNVRWLAPLKTAGQKNKCGMITILKLKE